MRKKTKIFSILVLPAVILLCILFVARQVLSNEPQSIRLEIHGISEPLRQQVRAYIGKLKPVPKDSLADSIDNIKLETARSLQAIGYYHSAISATQASNKAGTTITLQIDRGKPVRVTSIDIQITGEAEQHDEFTRELRNLSLSNGDIFNHGEYELLKHTLSKTAQRLGYFDARFTRAQVLITKKQNSAAIAIDFDSGKRYLIDNVVYQQNLYPEDFLQRWQGFDTEIPYRASYVRDLTVNLKSSGYFRKVRVSPDLQNSQDNKLPLLVELESARENTLGIGAGYATDTGARLRGNWLRPHTNLFGHSLETSSSISEIRQNITASYRIPHKNNPTANNYSIDVGLLNHRTEDTFSQLRTLEFGDHRYTKNNWRKDLFVRLENESFDVGSEENKINLLLPGIGFSKVISTGGIHPDKGRFFSFQLTGARRDLFSDINLTRATGAAKFLTSWNRKHYLIARAELGALQTDSFGQVPATHRFFAGGDNSVRGYTFQSISPRNADDEAIGGRFLSSGSLEYNHYLLEKFAVATFVDAGRVFNNSDDPLHVAAGMGFRWRSPFGPLRIDLARGINGESSAYRLHFAIGPEL